MQLTAARDGDLLRKIRSEALDSLIEMAQWRDSSHAYFSRVVLGRVAGIAGRTVAQDCLDRAGNRDHLGS